MLSTASPQFGDQVAKMLRSLGSVFVVVNFSSVGGRRSYEFYRCESVFKGRVARLPSKTLVVVMNGQVLPHRGEVDDDFIRDVEKNFVEGDEWLLTSASHDVLLDGISVVDYEYGETLSELRSALNDARGQEVALGVEPKWYGDSRQTVKAIVPLADGTVEAGSY